MNKYRNIKTVVDGITFDSKAESAYYGMLKLRKMAKDIDDFKMQVPFKLGVNGQLICTYVADFVTTKGETIEVIDVKGFVTPEFKLKQKLMKALFDIEIKIVR